MPTDGRGTSGGEAHSSLTSPVSAFTITPKATPAAASSLHQPKRPMVDAVPRPQSPRATDPLRTPESPREVQDRTATRILQTALDLLALPI
jgi:hypothetical protein